MKKIYSIIIPTYNCFELLEKSIKSILCQNENLYECIIIDGESTDGTVHTIKYFSEMFPNSIKYISEPDKNVYDAMNKGIDIAEGKYLYFLGAGDELVENCLSEVEKYLNFDIEMIYGNVYYKNILQGQEYDKKKICIDNICHQAIFYCKEIFDIIGKYDLKYSIFSDYYSNIKVFGVENIKKRYIDVNIANYLGNGISDKQVDKKFVKDLKSIISENLGESYYNYYLLSGKSEINEARMNNSGHKNENVGFLINSDLIDFIKNNNEKKIIVFGTSQLACNVVEYINNNTKMQIKCFLDNDIKKRGKYFLEKEILSVNDVNFDEDITIIIASTWNYDIRKQLEGLGVKKENIIVSSFW